MSRAVAGLCTVRRVTRPALLQMCSGRDQHYVRYRAVFMVAAAVVAFRIPREPASRFRCPVMGRGPLRSSA